MTISDPVPRLSPSFRALPVAFGGTMSGDVGWILVFCVLFVAALFGLLMLLAWLEPRNVGRHLDLNVPAVPPAVPDAHSWDH